MTDLLVQTTHMNFVIATLLSVGFGGLIGLERELRQKPAGLKTHAMIALGATVFTFASTNLSMIGDPTRIAAQVVSGIGFIGAGTILQSKRSIRGLTTAATLWVSASVGMLNGALMFDYAAILTLVVMAFLFFSNLFSSYKSNWEPYTANIEIIDISVLPKLEDMLEKFELKISHKALVKEDDVVLKLNYHATPISQHLFLKALFGMPGVGNIMRL